jgi:hypothetical protein
VPRSRTGDRGGKDLQAASGGSRDPGAQVSTEAGPEPRVERARCGHYGPARTGCRARGRARPAATPVDAPARSLDVLHLLASNDRI